MTENKINNILFVFTKLTFDNYLISIINRDQNVQHR
jgi:hypothetical protein